MDSENILVASYNQATTDLLCKYENNPCGLLTEINSVNDFLNLLFDDDSSIRVRALIVCKIALDEQSADQKHIRKLLVSIWVLLASKKGAHLKTITAICFLLDHLITIDEVFQELQGYASSDYLQKLFCTKEEYIHKSVMFILRRIYYNHGIPTDPWNVFLTVVNTLDEYKSHLNDPVLELIPQTESLPHDWHFILLAYAVTHPNTAVVRRVIDFIIPLAPVITYLNDHAPSILLFRNLLNALNTTTLYQANSRTNEDTLAEFFTAIGMCVPLIEVICTIGWKTVPFYHLSLAIIKVLTNEQKLNPTYTRKLIQYANVLPNKWIRSLIMSKWDMEIALARNKKIPMLWAFDNLNRECDYSKRTRDLIFRKAPTRINLDKLEIIIIEVIRQVNTIIASYFTPGIDVTVEKVENEVRTVIGIYLEFDDMNKSILQFMQSSEDWSSFSTEIIVNSSVLRIFGKSVNWDFARLHTLFANHLHLAMDLLKYKSIPPTSAVQLDELVSQCQEEIVRRAPHFVYSFLELIDYATGPMKAPHYDAIITLCAEKPKWRLVIIKYFRNRQRGPEIMLNFPDFILEGLLCGTPVKGDERLELALCEKAFGDHLPDECIGACAIRSKILFALIELYKKRLNSNKRDELIIKIFEYLKERCFDYIVQIYKDVSRYYPDSKTHRLLLRLIQVLAALISCDLEWDDKLIDFVLNENNQLNITYILECIIARTIPWDILFGLLGKSKTPRARRSIFMIMYYVCNFDATKVETAHKCIQQMLPFTMGKEFNARNMSQVIIRKIIEKFNLTEEYGWCYKTIVETLQHDDHKEVYERTIKDFRFSLHNDKLLSPIYYLHEIPRLTKMSSNEVIPLKLIEIPEDEKKTLRLPDMREEEPLIQADVIEFNINNVQRKMVPITELFPESALFKTKEQKTDSEPGLIVVASLVEKIANLGGLCRTCEIFGADELIIASKTHALSTEFMALSMTSEKWLPIEEKKPVDLVAYLIDMRRKGYAIIGAEQTAQGVSIDNFVFPKKSILLLGNEKFGIPVNLLSILDHAVEIPQFGYVRSLNVHVSGALFIWEYAKQHKITRTTPPQV